jgi:hypothetical protein
MSKQNQKILTKEEVKKLAVGKISELGISETQAKTYYQSALDSQCINWRDWTRIESWIEHQFKPNLVTLDQQDYLEAAIQSLRVQFNLASTDFGMSRQRDLGQKWSDTIRGYLGEIALRKYLKQLYQLEITLDHNRGELSQYVNSDVYNVKKIGEKTTRKSNLRISVKTTKANGIWLDIPGQQFYHSDVFILIKLGIGKDHLFSFFKEISFFKDKILKIGQDCNFLDEQEANRIYQQIDSFEPITAYIPGYILAKNYPNNNKFNYNYTGYKGKTNYTIIDYAGEYNLKNLEEIKQQELGLEKSGKVEFQSISKFTQQNRYIFGMKTIETNNNWNKDIITVI